MKTCKMSQYFEEPRASPILITDGNLPKSSANMIMMLGSFEKVIGKEEIVARNIMQDVGLMSAETSCHMFCVAYSHLSSFVW